jgi:hypothetical protein
MRKVQETRHLALYGTSRRNNATSTFKRQGTAKNQTNSRPSIHITPREKEIEILAAIVLNCKYSRITDTITWGNRQKWT